MTHPTGWICRFEDAGMEVTGGALIVICIRRSHYVFRKSDGSIFSIPVHHGKAKPFYVRGAKRQVGEG